MNFTFSFDEKLDFSKFKRHAIHYISYLSDKEINYHLLVRKYKFSCKINPKISNQNREMSFLLYEVNRDAEGYVTGGTELIPSINSKIEKIKLISNCYDSNSKFGIYQAKSEEDLFEFMCQIIKMLSKLDSLSVFV